MSPPILNGPPVHPGGLLREVVLPGADLTPAAAAARLGIEPHDLVPVLEERAPITAALALRLGRLLGAGGAEHWMRMQAAHDLRLAEAELGPALDVIACIEPPASL